MLEPTLAEAVGNLRTGIYLHCEKYLSHDLTVDLRELERVLDALEESVGLLDRWPLAEPPDKKRALYETTRAFVERYRGAPTRIPDPLHKSARDARYRAATLRGACGATREGCRKCGNRHADYSPWYHVEAECLAVAKKLGNGWLASGPVQEDRT